METHIADNVASVRERVAVACARVGRPPEGVTIIAVTKTHGAEAVDAIADAGIADVGENRVQEFLQKQAKVTRPVRWHLIGTLQRNKASKVVGRVELIHSVDRVKLAETLDRLSGENGVQTRVLLEVNTSRELTKHGFEPEEVAAAATAVAAMPNLELEGLMTIGPLTEDQTSIRRAFQGLFRLREKLDNQLGRPLPHLSMGMTDDFEIAIEEGATLIRVGRALFGARKAR